MPRTPALAAPTTATAATSPDGAAVTYDAEVVDLFAGPGGWDEGARIVEANLDIFGVEKNAPAAATARAAGFHRHVADVTTLHPTQFPRATGLIVSPPCPPFSASGRRLGLGDDYQAVLDAITCLGSQECGDECTCWELGEFNDPRSRLVIQTALWALKMPQIEWLVAEQVPAVEYMWEDLAAELMAADWEWVDVVNLDAADFGAGARRARTFLLAHRYRPGRAAYHGPAAAEVSMADVLGWPAGEKVRTRNNRRPTGGNLFSADGPSWCLTRTTRSWERDSDGARLTASEAGALQGFGRDYPWQGSRTAQFQQAGDVVSPLVAGAVLGSVLNLDWQGPVAERAALLAAGPRAAAGAA